MPRPDPEVRFLSLLAAAEALPVSKAPGKGKTQKEAFAASLDARGLARLEGNSLRITPSGRERVDAAKAAAEAAARAAAEKKAATARKKAERAARPRRQTAAEKMLAAMREVFRQVLAEEVLPRLRALETPRAAPPPPLRDALERELRGKRGAIPIGALRQALAVPRERLHDELRSLARDFVVDLQIAADPAAVPDPEEGIRTDRGLLYYVSLR